MTEKKELSKSELESGVKEKARKTLADCLLEGIKGKTFENEGITKPIQYKVEDILYDKKGNPTDLIVLGNINSKFPQRIISYPFMACVEDTLIE